MSGAAAPIEGGYPGVSIVIPNYNGEQLLRDNLPSVVAAMERWPGDRELIIVDDCSSDDSCRLIEEAFPMVRLMVNPRNMGFSRTCNAGMAAARFRVLLCINTDVKVEEDLLVRLVPHFADPDLFAVSPRIVVEREGVNQGAIFGRFSKGFVKGTFARVAELVPPRENLYAIGACAAYDAAKFRALKGYCEIYTPYLFEDVDICYRAWKRGWKSVHEPAVTVWHYSNATLGKAKRRRNRVIYFRNRFVFHWLNLSDPAFVAANVLNTLVRLMFSFLWGNFTYYEAFFGALARYGEIARVRRSERPHRRLGDAMVIRRAARR